MTFQSLHTFVLVFASLMTGQTALAQSEGTEIEAIKIFEYGESCAQLGQLSRVELLGITHQAYAEQFAVFCKPDSVYRCDDYNAYFSGLGTLEDNGMSCRYLPSK